MGHMEHIAKSNRDFTSSFIPTERNLKFSPLSQKLVLEEGKVILGNKNN